MKKILAMLGTVLFLAACVKEAPVEEPSINDIVFDFTVRRLDDTKGVKTAWENGDRIFVFFEEVSTGYLTLDYNGTEWTPTLRGSATVDALTESGKKLTAVYLPFNNSATCTYNDDPDPAFCFWSFDGLNRPNWAYYLMAEKVSYSVVKAGGITTLTATLTMAAPAGVVQIFIPDNEASSPIDISCSALNTIQLLSIGGDGTVNAGGSLGDLTVGHVATINGDKGYYAYFQIPDDWSQAASGSEGFPFYFTFDFGGGEYYDYCKIVDVDPLDLHPLAGGESIKIAKGKLHRVGPGYYVQFGSCLWSTVNYGMDNPWEYYNTSSKFFTWDTAPGDLLSGERIPTATEMSYFGTNPNGGTSSGSVYLYTIYAHSFRGVLCVDKADPTKYIFFSATGSYSSGGSYSGTGGGVYWTSDEYNASNGQCLRFYVAGKYFNISAVTWFAKGNRCPIRPVKTP